MLANTLYVALGGAVGASARYLFTFLPFKSSIPVPTLLVNFLGAILLGFFSVQLEQKSVAWALFWKTGVCGGFTTFSTFSLETFNLLNQKAYALAGLYMVASVLGCLLGIICGKKLALYA